MPLVAGNPAGPRRRRVPSSTSSGAAVVPGSGLPPAGAGFSFLPRRERPGRPGLLPGGVVFKPLAHWGRSLRARVGALLLPAAAPAPKKSLDVVPSAAPTGAPLGPF